MDQPASVERAPSIPTVYESTPQLKFEWSGSNDSVENLLKLFREPVSHVPIPRELITPIKIDEQQQQQDANNNSNNNSNNNNNNTNNRPNNYGGDYVANTPSLDEAVKPFHHISSPSYPSMQYSQPHQTSPAHVQIPPRHNNSALLEQSSFDAKSPDNSKQYNYSSKPQPQYSTHSYNQYNSNPAVSDHNSSPNKNYQDDMQFKAYSLLQDSQVYNQSGNNGLNNGFNQSVPRYPSNRYPPTSNPQSTMVIHPHFDMNSYGDRETSNSHDARSASNNNPNITSRNNNINNMNNMYSRSPPSPTFYSNNNSRNPQNQYQQQHLDQQGMPLPQMHPVHSNPHQQQQQQQQQIQQQHPSLQHQMQRQSATPQQSGYRKSHQIYENSFSAIPDFPERELNFSNMTGPTSKITKNQRNTPARANINNSNNNNGGYRNFQLQTRPEPNINININNNESGNHGERNDSLVASDSNSLTIIPSLLTGGNNGDAHYCDITEYLNCPQIEAARKLHLPPSTLSKRWKEAAPNRKWPWRTVCKLDKEISTLLHNIPPDGTIPEQIEGKLAILINQRQEELKPIVIRL